MNNSFKKVREDMLATLAKYPMQPLPEAEIEQLIQKYGKEQLIHSIRYLIGKKMINSKALYTDNEETDIDSDYFSLTADGYDIATDDELGYKISSVTIKIHSNTLNQLENIIKASNLKEADKKTLLSKLKEKGAEHLLGRMIDLSLSNAPMATMILAGLLK